MKESLTKRPRECKGPEAAEHAYLVEEVRGGRKWQRGVREVRGHRRPRQPGSTAGPVTDTACDPYLKAVFLVHISGSTERHRVTKSHSCAAGKWWCHPPPPPPVAAVGSAHPCPTQPQDLFTSPSLHNALWQPPHCAGVLQSSAQTL